MEVREEYAGKEHSAFVEKLLDFVSKILKYSEKDAIAEERMNAICVKKGIRKALGVETVFDRARKIVVEEARVLRIVELINDTIDIFKSEPFPGKRNIEFSVLNKLVNISLTSATDTELASIEPDCRLDYKAVYEIMDTLDLRLGALIHAVFVNPDAELRLMFQFSGLFKSRANLRDWSFSYNRDSEQIAIASEPGVDFEFYGNMKRFLKVQNMNEGNVDLIIDNIRDYFDKYPEAATTLWHHMNHARLYHEGTGGSLSVFDFPTFEQFKINNDRYANNPYAMICLLQSKLIDTQSKTK